MPLYEYLCDVCGQRFEIIQKFSDPAPEACRLCGKGPVHRQQSSPAIQFKGSGFYITDYTKKSGTDSSPGPKASDAKSSDGKGGETKSDSGSKSDSGTKTESAAKSESSTPAATTSTTPTTSKE